jgi:hypothetical protein
MDRLDDLLLGHGRLPRTKLHLINDREDALPCTLAGIARFRRDRYTAFEYMRLQLVAVAHAQLLPDFVREWNDQLAVADMRYRH